MIDKKFILKDKEGKQLDEANDMKEAFNKGQNLFREKQEEIFVVKEDLIAVIKNEN